MKALILFFVMVLAMLLTACYPSRSLIEIEIPTLTLQPRATEFLRTVPSTLSPTDTPSTRPPVPIVYYHFVAIASNTFPAGSVVIVPNVLVLAPTLSKIARSLDTATNIGSAMQAMINDPRNAWTSKDLGISSITFKGGTAEVVMQGEISGAGDAMLMAARMQILMTVFADDSVDTARIILNGENIANLGVSHDSEAKPDDYIYTRAEIETFMAKNAYKIP